MRICQIKKNSRCERTCSSSMDSSLGRQEDDAKRETLTDTGYCQRCHLTPGITVTMATISVIIGIFIFFILFVTWTAAPKVDQSSIVSGTELLEQCHKERHDLNLMLHTVTQDSRCRLCPDGWLWWGGHCYFFSSGLQENRQWNESTEFCQQHNSSLAIIRDSAEMDFIQGEMLKFSQVPFLWVGLTDTKQEGQWLWEDGTDVQHYMPLEVQWDADHRDCADLRGDGSVFAADCEAYGPWVCKRAS
ncbi:CD209 antigen-like protein C isoform X2 [Parambassis ranga]|uniref:CD209 antigen-like protein C isoform X2 n=1 Tax=Parambassis ranga TaxID=210632 RepID=A0A6P7K6F4_9TELE|nr:CD209 antigen-like protein C isoform X2 [Parambassis ranga]